MTSKLLKRFNEDDIRGNRFAPREACSLHNSMLRDFVATLYPLIPRNALPQDVFCLLRVALHASPCEVLPLAHLLLSL